MEALRTTQLIRMLQSAAGPVTEYLQTPRKRDFYLVGSWRLLMFHSVIIGMLLSKLYYWITVTVRADNGGPALSALPAPRRGGGCRESCC